MKFGIIRVRGRDDPDYKIKAGGVVPGPAIFKDLNCYLFIIYTLLIISSYGHPARRNGHKYLPFS